MQRLNRSRNERAALIKGFIGKVDKESQKRGTETGLLISIAFPQNKKS